jgi:hypothetical protein
MNGSTSLNVQGSENADDQHSLGKRGQHAGTSHGEVVVMKLAGHLDDGADRYVPKRAGSEFDGRRCRRSDCV